MGADADWNVGNGGIEATGGAAGSVGAAVGVMTTGASGWTGDAGAGRTGGAGGTIGGIIGGGAGAGVGTGTAGATGVGEMIGCGGANGLGAVGYDDGELRCNMPGADAGEATGSPAGRSSSSSGTTLAVSWPPMVGGSRIMCCFSMWRVGSVLPSILGSVGSAPSSLPCKCSEPWSSI
jgi:hypothetical protein